MILINLLPEEFRPIKKTPLPYIGAVLVSIAALAAVGLLIFNAMSETGRLRSEIARNQAELDSKQKIVDRYNELAEKKIGLRDKVETIEEILQGRKIWSRHLHRLAELTPENFWYSRIRETTQTFRESVPKLDPKTGQPITNEDGTIQMEQKRVPRPVLEVQGYVINDEDGRANVSALMEQAEDDANFSRHFELFRTNFEDTEFAGFNVRGFTLEFQIKSDAGEDEA